MNGRRLLLRKQITLEDIFNELRELQALVDGLTAEHRQMAADLKAVREFVEEDRW
jgi:prefoldin subunit 5